MIFRNKDAANSSIFGDSAKKIENKTDSSSDEMLENMRRRVWNEGIAESESMRKKVSRASSSEDDAAKSGRAFVGMNSARSIFSDKTSNENSIDAKTASEMMRNAEKENRDNLERSRRAEQNPEGDIVSKRSSAHASEHRRISTNKNSISIFDKNPFERMNDYKPEMKKDAKIEKNELKGFRQLTSKDITERAFDGFDASQEKKTIHHSAVDNLINKLKGI